MNKSSNILIENENEKEQIYEEMIEGVPVCGANFSSLIIDAGYYIDEIHYKIGNRLYIENAD